MKKRHSQVVIRPLINEKSTVLASMGKYTFEVKTDSNKVEIAQAVEELIAALYPKSKCQVLDVNTLAIRGRIRRSKRHGRAPRIVKRRLSLYLVTLLNCLALDRNINYASS